MKARERLYRQNVLSTRQLPVPVISVGNLSVGGTGKTPIVRWLAEFYSEAGFRPAILTRGYGGDESPEPQRVPVDRRRQSAARFGDEPCALASALPQMPVIAGTDRARSGEFAIETEGANVLFLDDGFQHLRLHRDLNICVVGEGGIPASERVLPAGPLREPRSALARADLFWVNLPEGGDTAVLESIEREVAEGRPVVGSIREPSSLTKFTTEGGRVPLRLETLQGEKAVLLSGIANPERFRRTAEACGAEVLQHFQCADHHFFSPKEIRDALLSVLSHKTHWLVTTEKDATRLDDLFRMGWRPPQEITLAVIDIRVRVVRGAEELERRLRDVVERRAI